MNTKDVFPALAAAPALLPLIAPFAAPILIGGAIAAGLIWLFSEDETPIAETAATPATWLATKISLRTELSDGARLRPQYQSQRGNGGEARKLF